MPSDLVRFTQDCFGKDGEGQRRQGICSEKNSCEEIEDGGEGSRKKVLIWEDLEGGLIKRQCSKFSKDYTC